MPQKQLKQLRREFTKLKARIRHNHATVEDMFRIRQLDEILATHYPKWRCNYK